MHKILNEVQPTKRRAEMSRKSATKEVKKVPKKRTPAQEEWERSATKKECSVVESKGIVALVNDVHDAVDTLGVAIGEHHERLGHVLKPHTIVSENLAEITTESSLALCLSEILTKVEVSISKISHLTANIDL